MMIRFLTPQNSVPFCHSVLYGGTASRVWELLQEGRTWLSLCWCQQPLLVIVWTLACPGVRGEPLSFCHSSFPLAGKLPGRKPFFPQLDSSLPTWEQGDCRPVSSQPRLLVPETRSRLRVGPPEPLQGGWAGSFLAFSLPPSHEPVLRSVLCPRGRNRRAYAVVEQAVLGVCREGTTVGVDREVALSGQMALV